MSKIPTQIAIRRASFEAHVAECSACKAHADSAILCAAANIMLARYVRALQEGRVS